MCFFWDTKLSGSEFYQGSVLVDSCLFAGEVESTTRFNMTGIQVGFTSTEIKLNTASLMRTCGGAAAPRKAGLPETAKVVATNGRGGSTEGAGRTESRLPTNRFLETGKVEVSGLAETGKVEVSRLAETAKVTASESHRPIVERAGSGEEPAAGGLQAWIFAVIGVGALLWAAVVAAFLVVRRRRRASQSSSTASSISGVGGDGNTTTTAEFTLGMATGDIAFSTFGDVVRECDSLVPDDFAF
jgi:hypothetical protein